MEVCFVFFFRSLVLNVITTPCTRVVAQVIACEYNPGTAVKTRGNRRRTCSSHMVKVSSHRFKVRLSYAAFVLLSPLTACTRGNGSRSRTTRVLPRLELPRPSSSSRTKVLVTTRLSTVRPSPRSRGTRSPCRACRRARPSLSGCRPARPTTRPLCRSPRSSSTRRQARSSAR